MIYDGDFLTDAHFSSFSDLKNDKETEHFLKFTNLEMRPKKLVYTYKFDYILIINLIEVIITRR